MDSNDQQLELRTAAWTSCALVAAGFTVYWIGEIQAVREMLALAYG